MNRPPRRLTMEIQPTVVDHLGLNMYTSLPAVLSELVANAWDADATRVDIVLEPRRGITEAIAVKDNGIGMTFDDVQQKYLSIGRNRRLAENRETSPKGRLLMGRKGIGKLSGFGVVNSLEVRTVQNRHLTHFLLEISEMRKATAGDPYHPRVIEDRRVTEPSGTAVTLRGLKRRRRIDIKNLRIGLARRFTVLGDDFLVAFNGRTLTVAERNLRAKCEFVWTVGEELPGTLSVAGETLEIKGWVGTFKDTVPQDIGNGIAVIVRGKLAQEPTLYDIVKSHGQVAWSYIVGEISADFLDQGPKDRVATHRSAIVWESEEGGALKTWIQEAMQRIAREWVQKRGQKHVETIKAEPRFASWVNSLSERDKKHALKVVNVVAALPKATNEERKMLMEYVVESFEHRSFLELLQEIENVPEPQGAELLRLFKELKIIEAKEILRVLEVRLAAITQLDRLIATNAREVPEIHSFLADNPWFLDPTWTVVNNEVSYAALLRSEFPDDDLPVENRRIDFVCVGVGDTVHVVELKRPSVRIKAAELGQLTEYVTFVKDRLGTHPTKGYKDAAGYLIGGELDPRARTSAKDVYERGRIYFYSYTDLLSNARKVHQAFVQAISKIAKGRPTLAAFLERRPATAGQKRRRSRQRRRIGTSSS